MMNLFYARYVPPSSAGNIESDTKVAESVKRRKTDTGAVTIITPKEGSIKYPIESNYPNLEIVREEIKRKRKSKLKKSRGNGEWNASPEPTGAFEGGTTITESDDHNTHRGRVEVLAEESTLLKKKKKKRRETLPVEALESKDDSVSPKDPPQKEDFVHSKIRAKWEKSAVLARKESELTPGSKSGLKAGEDEAAPPIEARGLVPIPQPQQGPHAEVKTTTSSLPDWLAYPTVARVADTISLDALSIHPTTLASLRHKGYQDAFAVQATVLPLLLPGPDQYPGDICISAATGTGKTLAYALPLIENLRDRPVTKLRGLIVVPTRELVAQARDYLEVCASGSRLQIGTAVGSKSIQEEQDHLVDLGQRYDPEEYQAEQEKGYNEIQDLMDWDFDNINRRRNEARDLINYVDEYTSKVDILICTPGRLVDHMRSTKGFTLAHVQWLVIDEADRLLEESFQEWIDIIMPALTYHAPLNPMDQQLNFTFHLVRERMVRKIVLSATMTKDIGKITALQLRRPKMVLLETTQQPPTTGAAPSTEQLDAGLERDIQLPPTLLEIAIPIANAEEKPLHLIHLLEDSNGLSKGLIGHPRKFKHHPKPSSPASEVATEDRDSESDFDSESDSDSSSTSSVSSSDSHRSNGVNPQAKPTPADGILIFTSNNENALRLARLLALLRPLWTPIIHTLTKSSSSHSARKILSSFGTRTQQGKGSILIASDRASRGLDLPRLARVVSYDMPPSMTAYVHRVGRTARAGRDGVATTLVAHHEARWFWNEIARNKGIGRGENRKVRRVEPKREITDEERRSYAEALKVLGREARGEPR